MTESIETIPVEQLLDKTRALRAAGNRLVQLSMTALPEQFEITYSFDLQGQLSNLRVLVSRDAASLPSISTIFGAAALYENEIHDLFGLNVTGMTLDFHGHLYQTAIKYPMSTKMAPPVPPAKPAPKPAAPKPAASANSSPVSAN